MLVFWGVLYFSSGWPGTLWLSLVSNSCMRFSSVNHYIQLLFSCHNKILGFSCLHFLPKNGDQLSIVIYIYSSDLSLHINTHPHLSRTDGAGPGS